MAVAGGGIPSFPVRLREGRIEVLSWATNKPKELVVTDLDEALERLKRGERIELHCSGPQVMLLRERLAAELIDASSSDDAR